MTDTSKLPPPFVHEGTIVRWTDHALERAIERMRFDDAVPYERIANKGKDLRPGSRFVVGAKDKTKYICKRGSHTTVLILTVLDAKMAANKAHVRRSAANDNRKRDQ